MMVRALLVFLVIYLVVGALFVWTLRYRVSRPIHAPASLAYGDVISEGISRE